MRRSSTTSSIMADQHMLEQVLIKGPGGYAVMVSAASGTLLLVLATHQAKLGLIFFDMARAVEQVKKIL